MNDVVTTYKYNKIYQTLVDEEPSIEGMVAYCFYKTAKREWVMSYCEQHQKQPSEAEMDAYTASWTQTRLDGLMTEANAALAGYASSVIAAERPKIFIEALKERSFVREVFAAFVGALAWTLFLIMAALLARYAHVDIFSIFSSVNSDHG